MEFTWYVKHPNKCKLIRTAFMNRYTKIYQKVEARYGLESQSIYYELLKDVDISILRCEKEKVLNILKWFLTGFNNKFLFHIQIQDKANIDNIQKENDKSLTDYISILKYGRIKGEV